MAEEAARGLAESNIRILDDGVPRESVSAEVASELMSAAKSGNYDELARVTVRLYTEETTLYRVLTRAIREDEENAGCFVRRFEPDLGLGMAATFRSVVPDGFGSFAVFASCSSKCF
jgi:hypothetical protein